ncbi:GNAT family acetyltransferase [Caballeronia sp. SEWSISQ10-4 2]|uniref:GNAT family acetyltransferase n=1 Tax=Caballeronia sp. SEWSISQ10-4 2 TaxID=2937438 RepID=UPI002651A85B|nr:GNAT family acetyltransferase [Caballeronia sp. SEWSISQ10-4 2]MDN7176819.1 GNAT family acetyltransferase [Caballeronia sp. SEWSISQ10-4 2]
MIIRVFDERDTQAVLALWVQAFPEYATPGKPQRDPRLSIRNKLAMQPELFFVGLLNERLIGTVMAGYDGHRGWLYSLAVAEDQRGKGYGRALVEHAERALASIGCPKLNLQIMANKPEAQGFYAKLGYQMDEVVSFGKRL